MEEEEDDPNRSGVPLEDQERRQKPHMPTKIDEHISEKRFNKVGKKIEMFKVWDKLCRGS